MKGYRKGVKLLAVNKVTDEKIKFKVPADGMCKKLLTRYLVMNFEVSCNGSWMFIEQE